MEIGKYFYGTNGNYKLDWIETNDKLFAILNQDHEIYLDNLHLTRLNDELMNWAAKVIQRRFRSYVDRLIFKKISNILTDYRYTNPSVLLRRKNINESCLFDKIACYNLELRLSGDSFPPTIVYKIYSHAPLTKRNRFKTDVIPISKRDSNVKMQSNDQWKVIYTYKARNLPALQKTNQNKWKADQTARKQPHKRNKNKLTWIFSRYQ